MFTPFIPEYPKPTDRQVGSIVREVNKVFPDLELSPSDVENQFPTTQLCSFPFSAGGIESAAMRRNFALDYCYCAEEAEELVAEVIAYGQLSPLVQGKSVNTQDFNFGAKSYLVALDILVNELNYKKPEGITSETLTLLTIHDYFAPELSDTWLTGQGIDAVALKASVSDLIDGLELGVRLRPQATVTESVLTWATAYSLKHLPETKYYGELYPERNSFREIAEMRGWAYAEEGRIELNYLTPLIAVMFGGANLLAYPVTVAAAVIMPEYRMQAAALALVTGACNLLTLKIIASQTKGIKKTRMHEIVHLFKNSHPLKSGLIRFM